MQQFALHLYRRDPARNIARFYRLSLEPTLFGDVALVREWGRIGTQGRRRLDLFAHGHEADSAFRALSAAKIRRGYRELVDSCQRDRAIVVEMRLAPQEGRHCPNG